jgi:hypothetical protein
MGEKQPQDRRITGSNGWACLFLSCARFSLNRPSQEGDEEANGRRSFPALSFNPDSESKPKFNSDSESKPKFNSDADSKFKFGSESIAAATTDLAQLGNPRLCNSVFSPALSAR